MDVKIPSDKYRIILCAGVQVRYFTSHDYLCFFVYPSIFIQCIFFRCYFPPKTLTNNFDDKCYFIKGTRI